VTSREFRERLLRRAKRADLAIDPAVLDRLETYYRLLARWSSTINLTAFPMEDLSDRALDRLLIEPLTAARFVPDAAVNWFDLGSGAGSPALPLKFARPAARLTMVESKTRKAAFLREAVRTLQLLGAVVEHARFEEVADREAARGRVDLVTVRAVRVDSGLLDATASLLAPGGRFFLFTSDAARPLRRAPFETVDVVKLGEAARLVQMEINAR